MEKIYQTGFSFVGFISLKNNKVHANIKCVTLYCTHQASHNSAGRKQKQGQTVHCSEENDEKNKKFRGKKTVQKHDNYTNKHKERQIGK